VQNGGMQGSFESRIVDVPGVFDAALGERTIETLGERVGRGALSDLIRVTASNSPHLAREFAREGDFIARLKVESAEAAIAAALGDLHEVPTLPRAEAMRVLRETKRRVCLVIALADVGGVWNLDQVTGSLTDLADRTLRAALLNAFHEGVARERFRGVEGPDPLGQCGLFFLAMGKYGARELNYSSDIDFSCYFNPELLPVTGKVGEQEAAVRLTQSTVSLMQETTQDGYVFRCDLRLRPDAGSTQIAVSTRLAEGYYESMGQNWERAAMIKARVCAGDATEGAAFMQHLQPFVWRKYLDYAAIEDIHSIKRQIHAHGGHGAIRVPGHNIKLGRGGIREIEFFAQTQQLILGGRMASLRISRTEDALVALAQRGVIAQGTCADLRRAYRFLRTLEHRLQMIEDQQTHSLPKHDGGLDNVARFMGFASRDELGARLTSELQCVQGHYTRLFESQPSLSKSAGSLVFTGVDEDPETIDTLRKMGFAQPEAMSTTIRGWHHGRIRATRSERAREKLTSLMPLLLDALAQTANPDIAFTRLDRFLSGLPSGVQVFALLLSNPALLGLISEIVGTAPRLADHLAARPGLLDVLIDAEFLHHQPSVGELRDGLTGLLRTSRSFEETLDVVRRWTKDQQFRVGLQLLQNEIDGIAAGKAFADVADIVIEALFSATLSELGSAHGQVPGGGMVVIALGRLGGREMSATSDLDLIFVYDHAGDVTQSSGGRPLAPSVYFARCSQRLITALTAMTAEGGLYEVDMRLRPSGNKGPVAVSFETFRAYQMQEAWTWERLALTRARIVAGPPALVERVRRVIDDALSAERDPAKTLADVGDMRARLDRERPGKSPWDLKEAKGGLFDVEFIAQGLQLVHAGTHKGLVRSNSLEALEALQRCAALAHGDADELNAALTVYQNLVQILRLTVGDSFDAADATKSLRSLIARSAGVASFEDVEPLLVRHEARVRLLFETLIGLPTLA
jgi:glutamate-ammonia-ligase adenylyltransferase